MNCSKGFLGAFGRQIGALGLWILVISAAIVVVCSAGCGSGGGGGGTDPDIVKSDVLILPDGVWWKDSSGVLQLRDHVWIEAEVLNTLTKAKDLTWEYRDRLKSPTVKYKGDLHYDHYMIVFSYPVSHSSAIFLQVLTSSALFDMSGFGNRLRYPEDLPLARADVNRYLRIPAGRSDEGVVFNLLLHPMLRGLWYPGQIPDWGTF
jgi:hypothetical protein